MYRNVLIRVDNIISMYKLHVRQFNIIDIKCTILCMYISKTNHYSANSFISLLSTVPQVCAYYFHTRNDYIDLLPLFEVFVDGLKLSAYT